MANFIIDVPVPSMGATVSELTIINIAVTLGAKVTKGQKLAELESDKSAFDFESPAAGTVLEINATAGEVKSSGKSLFRLETADESLRHLAVSTVKAASPAASPTTGPVGTTAVPHKTLAWTPRAIKMAQEAGLEHQQIHDIAATGPGGRVSGDDVTAYLAARK